MNSEQILRLLNSERARFRSEVRKWERVEKLEKAQIYRHYADSIDLILYKLAEPAEPSASPQKSIPAADLLKAAGHRCKPETCGCLCGTSYSKEWRPVISQYGMGGGAPKCKCAPQPVAGEGPDHPRWCGCCKTIHREHQVDCDPFCACDRVDCAECGPRIARRIWKDKPPSPCENQGNFEGTPKLEEIARKIYAYFEAIAYFRKKLTMAHCESIAAILRPFITPACSPPLEHMFANRFDENWTQEHENYLLDQIGARQHERDCKICKLATPASTGEANGAEVQELMRGGENGWGAPQFEVLIGKVRLNIFSDRKGAQEFADKVNAELSTPTSVPQAEMKGETK